MSNQRPGHERASEIASDLRKAATELSGERERRATLGKRGKDLEHRVLLAAGVWDQSAGEKALQIDHRALLEKLDDIAADLSELAADLAVPREEVPDARKEDDRSCPMHKPSWSVGNRCF